MGVRGIVFGVLLLGVCGFSAPKLVINEVMTYPRNYGFIDPVLKEFVVSDWIEIYNAGDSEVDLTGMYLTNNCAVPKKCKIPKDAGLKVKPRGFVVIWFAGYYAGWRPCEPPDEERACPRPLPPHIAPFTLGVDERLSLREWARKYDVDDGNHDDDDDEDDKADHPRSKVRYKPNWFKAWAWVGLYDRDGETLIDSVWVPPLPPDTCSWDKEMEILG